MLTILEVVTQELNHKWQWWIRYASALPWEGQDFPRGSVGKESAWNAGNTGDLGSIPRSGRFSGVGNGNPLQHSCMENARDRGAWLATVRGVTKSRTRLKQLSARSCISICILCFYLDYDKSWDEVKADLSSDRNAAFAHWEWDIHKMPQTEVVSELFIQGLLLFSSPQIRRRIYLWSLHVLLLVCTALLHHNRKGVWGRTAQVLESDCLCSNPHSDHA